MTQPTMAAAGGKRAPNRQIDEITKMRMIKAIPNLLLLICVTMGLISLIRIIIITTTTTQPTVKKEVPSVAAALEGKEEDDDDDDRIVIATTTPPATILGNDACPEGWVLPQIDPAMRHRVEVETRAWHTRLPTILRESYNAASERKEMRGQVREPAGHDRFDVIMPAIIDACPNLSLIGSDNDGGKLICGLDRIPDDGTTDNPCVVYSVGSNNQWDFEAGIVTRTKSCRVHTFDCTVDGIVPSNIQDRVTFHKICLGSKTIGGEVGSFLSLGKMMSMLGHDHITLLKMDIEGYEYDVFEEVLSERGVNLPEQISFEIHYITQMQDLDWWGRERTAGEMALFSLRLYEAGYRVISREDNKFCKHCSELTVVRFQCPAL